MSSGKRCALVSYVLGGGGEVRKTFLYQKNILFASKKTHLVGTLEKCVLILKSYSTCGVGYGKLQHTRKNQKI
ncbi:hypothetical protein LEP1GSC021_3569 [Leptospira noguchii str. 1993005606]|uniref:hypothetical protein n=1 Tax=Leptospira noguchii TaxID=28182 RepID=UPI000353E61D|nr:hypothetical protein [Leptospira noguchii]EPE83272.1 hypothetical protein LEP1GSC021_3569 [Leptospira noguchii str. 1993005606]